jgi:putative transcriptional regulator
MAEAKQGPDEATIRRWSAEDEDDWGPIDLATVRVVYPAGADPENVGAVRRAIGLTQAELARAVGISVATLRVWERGRRTPQGPAKALLKVIAREPAAARRALAG